jgi:hypothetical protein
VRQIVSFCQPVRDQSPLGFRCERVDGEKITDADKPALRGVTVDAILSAVVAALSGCA